MGRPRLDLTGQRFGRLVVVREDDPVTETSGKKSRRWLVRCDCGEEKRVRQNSLTNGNTKSCGCLKSELVAGRLRGRIPKNFRDYTGEVFGKLTVIRQDGWYTHSSGQRKSKWLCSCECGTTKTVVLDNLRSGATKSCGRCRDYVDAYVTKGGYLKVRLVGHPRADKNNRVWEHIIIMEQKIGRHLLPGENVHHINGVRDDNRPENLELWSSSQPSGQRVEDKVAWAKELLSTYEPDSLLQEV